MHQSRSIRRKNFGYDPYFTQTDIEERCGVCGTLNDIDYPSTRGLSEPVKFGGITIITTGTNWVLDTEHPGVEGLADKDLQHEARAVGGCILCGSGNWRYASGPGGNARRV